MYQATLPSKTQMLPKIKIKTETSIHSWGISEVQPMPSNAPKTCAQRLLTPGRSASKKATPCMLCSNLTIIPSNSYALDSPNSLNLPQT
jgi:hypothetical protein